MSVLRRCVLAIGIVAVPYAVAATSATAQLATGKVPDAAALRRGEQIYTRCAACHAMESNRTGPQHCGLFGRRAGTAPGFDTYSKAMRDSKIVWSERTLDVFLQAPTQAVPGTAMGYAGVKDVQERADLIAWLRQASRPGKGCSVSH